MKYRKMNGTGIYVSDVCLGTMNFGGQTSEEESLKIIDYAINNGINFIDTADSYNNRASEHIVGKALKGRREDIILATKVRYQTGEGLNQRGLNRRHILKNIEDSLKALQTDYIDIYYMHAMDGDVGFEETLDTMSTLIRSGKVRYLGISNYPAWQVSELMWLAKQEHDIPPIVTQNMYNVITRDLEAELVPCIQRHKIGLTAYNPIAGGLLSGKYEQDKEIEANTRFALKSNYVTRYWKPENFAALKELTAIAKERDMSLLSLSLKWCLSHSYVDSVICGISKLEQIKQNIEAVTGGYLDATTMQLCDAVGDNLRTNRVPYFKY